jgi:hypothetical protein
MRQAVLGALVGVGLMAAAVGFWDQRGEVYGQRMGVGPAGGGGGELVVVPTPVGEKTQLLTVVDPRQQVMSVYGVDLATGRIALKSVRTLRWDMQMMYMNNEPPLPQEIRSSLEPR